MSELTQDEVAVIWAEINALNCELDALYADAATNILRRDAGRLNTDCEQRAAVLRRKLAEVRAKLPECGEASGQRLVIASTLGTITLRDWPEPQPAAADGPVDIWDWSEP